MRTSLISAVFLIVLASGAFAQAPGSNGIGVTGVRAKIDVSKLGPQVGDRVPAFSLNDQNGRITTLESVAGAKGTMLVFFRSADW